MSNTSKLSAAVTKSFLSGFVKCAEMSFHCLVFYLHYFTFIKSIHLFASVLNAECSLQKGLLLLVRSGGEVGTVPLCFVMVRFEA